MLIAVLIKPFHASVILVLHFLIQPTHDLLGFAVFEFQASPTPKSKTIFTFQLSSTPNSSTTPPSKAFAQMRDLGLHSSQAEISNFTLATVMTAVLT